MLRVIFTALFGLFMTAAMSSAPAQEPKEKKKGPPRIAIDDPAKLKDDADFAAQGEYVGHAGTSKVDDKKVGAQVVALGDGKFDVKWYIGGLPGDGWDGKPPELLKGVLKEGKVILLSTSKGSEMGEVGVIDNRKLMLPIVAELKKTERKSPTLGAKPPVAEGAVVLFDGPESLPRWDKAKLAQFTEKEFLLSVNKSGDIRSTPAFGSFRAHVEFRLAWMPNSRGQGRSNSGVYVQDRYEIQVLDSFGLKGENNECGGVYTQHKPLVNMCYPPMTWQTYDIDFTAAEFEGDKKVKAARLTVLHNGVKIHDNVELKGSAGGGVPESAKPGPFRLQDHGDPLVYRNIWVVEKK